MYCCIKTCENKWRNTKKTNNEHQVRYFSFPKNPIMIEKWKKICGKENINPKCARVCSDHFDSSCYKQQSWIKKMTGYSPPNVRKLNPNAVPVEFLKEHSIMEMTSTVDTGPSTSAIHNDFGPTVNSMFEKASEAVSDPSTSAIECDFGPTVNSMFEKASEAVSDPSTSVIECDFGPTVNSTFEKASEAVSDPLTSVIECDFEPNGIAGSMLEMVPVADPHPSTSELETMRRTCTALAAENKALRLQLARKNKLNKKQFDEKMKKLLSRFFTPGQIKMLLNPTLTRVRWCSEDIAAAISLRSISPRAYRYLQKSGKHPLPGMSTLRKWVACFSINEGILEDVFHIMKSKGQSMTYMDKLVAICFDEIYLSNKIAIERREERIIGPHKRCQVVIARGLFKKWKQPIYYNFDQDITLEILLNIITNLFNIGFIVVAMTSDLGPANKALLGRLNVYPFTCGGKTFFEHPCDPTLKIHIFLDIPHLIKLLRNHFIDSGIYINGKLVNSAALERLLQLNSSDLKIAFKLTRLHLDAQGTQRQNVKLATQVFSNTNAAAIEWCILNGLMDNSPEWHETANFLRTFNEWFDLFNSVGKYGSHPGLNAFGTNIDEQNAILTKVSSIVKNMRVSGHNSLLPFQKGILLSNVSLKNLYDDLMMRCNANKCPMSYIMTNRLNQDILENLFSYIRAMGAANDRPSALDIRYRLRWYILGKHSIDVFTEGSNTSIQDCNNDEPCLTGGVDVGLVEESTVGDDDAEFNIANVSDTPENIINENTLNEENTDYGNIHF